MQKDLNLNILTPKMQPPAIPHLREREVRERMREGLKQA